MYLQFCCKIVKKFLFYRIYYGCKSRYEDYKMDGHPAREIEFYGATLVLYRSLG